ncbi:MAG: muconolactone Delta-isomerase family protein [bacterium]|nr:muconolactone Delta-isomerase family protein [bacterium]
MKKQFMVEIFLPNDIDLDFMRMIPAHRAYINELIAAGQILSYSISFDRSKGWIIFLSERADEVLDIVQQFPIHQFITIEINELFIHDGEAYRFPKLNFN